MIKQTATYGVWKVDRHDDNKVEVYKNGELCEKSTPALREIAAEIGLELNPEWRTSQLGANVLKAMLGAGEAKPQTKVPETPQNEPSSVSATEIDSVYYEVPDSEYFEIQRKIRENIDREKILNELKYGHEKGDVRATMILAKLYGSLGKITTGGGKQDEWNLYLELAEKGNLYAISMLKYEYERGQYLEKDDVLAIVCDICADFLKSRHNRPDRSIWETIKRIAKFNKDSSTEKPLYKLTSKLKWTEDKNTAIAKEKDELTEEKRLKYNQLVDEYNNLLEWKEKYKNQWNEETQKVKDLENQLADLKSKLAKKTSDTVEVKVSYKTWYGHSRSGIKTIQRIEYKSLVSGSIAARVAFVKARFEDSELKYYDPEDIHIELV